MTAMNPHNKKRETLMKKALIPIACLVLALAGCSSGSDNDAAPSKETTAAAASSEAGTKEAASEESANDEAPAPTDPFKPGDTLSVTDDNGTVVTVHLTDVGIPSDFKEVHDSLPAFKDDPIEGVTLTMDVDNRKSDQEFYLETVYLYDAEGNEYEFYSVGQLLDVIEFNIDEATNNAENWSDYYDQVSAVSENYPTSVRPSAKKEGIVYVGKEVPDEIMDVQVDGTYVTGDTWERQ
ncbi:hypothetical protein HMPREF1484_00206 [Dermabacter sp. HFH0086]|nr:hypothetical protein HMPREF1484_00206 [Dermabacter sp. HFH0086]